MSTARKALDVYEAQAGPKPRPVFEWSARYDTGLAEVDDQHRRLVDIINHVDRLLRAESPISVLEPVLDELTEYARYHFDTEERLMDSLRCEPAHVQRHKLAHEGFVKQVALMRGQASVNPTGVHIVPQCCGSGGISIHGRSKSIISPIPGTAFRPCAQVYRARSPSGQPR